MSRHRRLELLRRVALCQPSLQSPDRNLAWIDARLRVTAPGKDAQPQATPDAPVDRFSTKPRGSAPVVPGVRCRPEMMLVVPHICVVDDHADSVPCTLRRPLLVGLTFMELASRAPCQDPTQGAGTVAGVRVWVDFTASAHPLVFRPLVERLQARGDEVEITARDYAQTLQLIESHGMTATVIGHHGGRSSLGKARQMRSRLSALRALGERPRLRSRARARLARADDDRAPARHPERDDVRLRVGVAAAPARLPRGDARRRARRRSRPSGSRATAHIRRSSSSTRA